MEQQTQTQDKLGTYKQPHSLQWDYSTFTSSPTAVPVSLVTRTHSQLLAPPALSHAEAPNRPRLFVGCNHCCKRQGFIRGISVVGIEMLVYLVQGGCVRWMMCRSAVWLLGVMLFKVSVVSL